VPDFIDLIQKQIIFPRPRMDRKVLDGVALRVGARVVHLRTRTGEQLYGWYREAAGQRVVLFHHGNAETVIDRLPLQDLLMEWGWDVFTYAYRGYPGSTGLPSEAGLRDDAIAAWDYLHAVRGFAPKQIVVHGKSLGGGVSALLAEQRLPAGLVMESTFTSIIDVAQSRFPFLNESLIQHRFETRKRAPRILCPTLVMHGDDDRVIPVEQGRELGTLFPNAQYVEVPGAGHGESLPVVESHARHAYRDFLAAI
jgi:uncharacterized protein